MPNPADVIKTILYIQNSHSDLYKSKTIFILDGSTKYYRYEFDI